MRPARPPPAIVDRRHMAQPAPLYDLFTLIDPTLDDERRAAIRDAARDIVEADGTIVTDQEWGVRPLAYEINHKSDADYHLLQFHAPRSVLETLDRTLSITDGVMRHRIIRLAPGTPPAPDPPRIDRAAPVESVGA
jgi:small subunit ribosomal protein S6